MKKKLLLGMCLASTFLLASCGEVKTFHNQVGITKEVLMDKLKLTTDNATVNEILGRSYSYSKNSLRRKISEFLDENGTWDTVTIYDEEEREVLFYKVSCQTECVTEYCIYEHSTEGNLSVRTGKVYDASGALIATRIHKLSKDSSGRVTYDYRKEVPLEGQECFWLQTYAYDEQGRVLSDAYSSGSGSNEAEIITSTVKEYAYTQNIETKYSMEEKETKGGSLVAYKLEKEEYYSDGSFKRHELKRLTYLGLETIIDEDIDGRAFYSWKRVAGTEEEILGYTEASTEADGSSYIRAFDKKEDQDSLLYAYHYDSEGKLLDKLTYELGYAQVHTYSYNGAHIETECVYDTAEYPLTESKKPDLVKTYTYQDEKISGAHLVYQNGAIGDEVYTYSVPFSKYKREYSIQLLNGVKKNGYEIVYRNGKSYTSETESTAKGDYVQKETGDMYDENGRLICIRDINTAKTEGRTTAEGFSRTFAYYDDIHEKAFSYVVERNGESVTEESETITLGLGKNKDQYLISYTSEDIMKYTMKSTDGRIIYEKWVESIDGELTLTAYDHYDYAE